MKEPIAVYRYANGFILTIWAVPTGCNDDYKYVVRTKDGGLPTCPITHRPAPHPSEDESTNCIQEYTELGLYYGLPMLGWATEEECEGEDI